MEGGNINIKMNMVRLLYPRAQKNIIRKQERLKKRRQKGNGS